MVVFSSCDADFLQGFLFLNCVARTFLISNEGEKTVNVAAMLLKEYRALIAPRGGKQDLEDFLNLTLPRNCLLL